MLDQIEKTIKDTIKTNIETIRQALVQKGGPAISAPSVFVACEEGKFERQSKTIYKQYAQTYVEIEYKDLGSEEARRKGALLLLKAVVQLLLLQKLGLDIDPLTPKKWAHITDKQDSDESKARFQIIFETGFTIEKTSEEEGLENLLKINMDYFFKPGDENADAEDPIVLEQP